MSEPFVVDINVARVWLCRHEGFTPRQVQDMSLDELFDLYAESKRTQPPPSEER